MKGLEPAWGLEVLGFLEFGGLGFNGLGARV